MVKTIPLDGKRGAGRSILVDDHDYTSLANYSWALSTGGYARAFYKGKRRSVSMHQIILKAGPGYEVDHKNGDKLDNQRNNLRVATRSQNVANRVHIKHGISGYQGVHWEKPNKKWRAYIKYSGKRIYLGLYESKHEAAHIYNQVAEQLFGEFAVLNKIGE